MATSSRRPCHDRSKDQLHSPSHNLRFVHIPSQDRCLTRSKPLLCISLPTHGLLHLRGLQERNTAFAAALNCTSNENHLDCFRKVSERKFNSSSHGNELIYSVYGRSLPMIWYKPIVLFPDKMAPTGEHCLSNMPKVCQKCVNYLLLSLNFCYQIIIRWLPANC